MLYDHCGILVTTTVAGEPDARGQMHPSIWNAGGSDAACAAWLAASVGAYLSYGFTRFALRAPWGVNALGVRMGVSYSTSLDAASQLVTNFLGARHSDTLRNTTTSGLTTCLEDDRLARGWPAALDAYTPYVDEIVINQGGMPSGVKVAGSSGTTPSAWDVSSDAAVDAWDTEILSLARRSPRARIAIAIDTSPLDRGGGAGARPAENAVNDAYFARLKVRAGHDVYFEPPAEKNKGGTTANMAYVGNPRNGLIAVRNPDPLLDVAARGAADPSHNYTRLDVPDGRYITYVDGTFTSPADRADKCLEDIAAGRCPFFEPAGMSSAALRAIYDAAVWWRWAGRRGQRGRR